ncbi:MAG: SDR family oxidoreductase [Hyphomonadaceae bacterium]
MAQGMYAGRLALITGASAGLGRCFADHYAEGGADVVLVARRLEKLQTVASEIEAKTGVRAYVIAQDLSVRDAHKLVFEQVAALGKPVDILINNAGFSIPQKFADTEWSRQEAFIGTLANSVASFTHTALPHMLEQGWGRIINVSSMLAYAPGGVGHTLYPAAKAFVLRFSQSLHHELRGSGVHCTATCPGSTATDFKRASGIGDGGEVHPSLFVESVDKVVRGAMRANTRNKAVHVSGWHNKIAVSAMQFLPDEWFAPFARIAATKD